jgi:hypothetical protein
MKFAKWVFLVAGVVGILELVPLYFSETKIGLDYPPAITHPEFFYGFVGVALAWQVLFLILARDPVRYRLMMLPGILEKLGYGLAVMVLFAMHRLAPLTLVFGSLDLLWVILFAMAFRATRPSGSPPG